jgi:hypothetical protein
MNKALTLGVVSVAITAGTYFVLHAIAPQRHVEEKRQQQGPTVDEVFASQLNLAALDSAEAPAAPAPAEATPAGDTATADEAAPVEASADPVAAEASVDAAVADAGNGDMGAVDVAAAPPPAAEPAPAAEEAPPAAEPPPAEPAPAPAPAPVAAAPKPKAEAPKAASKPAEKKKPAPAKPVSPWWGAESPNELSLVYAGSAAYKKAVVLMFNGTFDSADSADKNIKVKDAAGNAVSGKWELGANNKKMLVFPVAKNGRYTVTVGSGVADRNNRALGKKLSGPVQVQ